jgi:hypothetical protein
MSCNPHLDEHSPFLLELPTDRAGTTADCPFSDMKSVAQFVPLDTPGIARVKTETFGLKYSEIQVSVPSAVVAVMLLTSVLHR